MSSSVLVDGWQLSLLCDLATIKKGTLASTAASGELVPYLGAESLGGKPPRIYAQSISAVIVEPNDVVMLWDGERSGLCGTGLEGVAGSTLARLRPKPVVEPKFLYWALARKFDYIQGHRTGTGIPHVPKDLDRFLTLKLPTVLHEQRRIVAVLETVEDAIRSTERVIAKLDRMKQGLLHDLLVRGIDENGVRPVYDQRPDLYSNTSVGRVPKSWDVGLLDSVATRGSGHTPNKNVPSYWNGGIKWVSLADSDRLDNVFIYETDKEISELGIANSSAVKHTEGTVILSRDAGVGKSAILGGMMAVSQHFMAWTCGPRLNNIYLYYWLQHAKPRFEAIAIGSTIKTIGLPYFRKLEIAVPPRPEQDGVASRMLDTDGLIWKSEAELDKLWLLKLGLMDDLLTGGVRVRADNEEAL